MVRGLDIFKKFFQEYTDCYIIIGGTACDIIIDDAGLTPRATKDIDIILVIEALTPEFGKHFWKFVKEAGYQQKEQSPDKLEYFRFLKPKNVTYPQQIELFAREPDTFELDEDVRLTPIPVDDDITSLSAILMSEDYYRFTIEHSTSEDGIHRANSIALIILKVKAFLDLEERKEQGEKIDSRNIKKHKTDVFRLTLLLTDEDQVILTNALASDFTKFVDAVKTDLPDPAIFKEMGAGRINPKDLLNQLLNTIKIK